ncbi:MAG: cation diffusion facilitator family transporter [Treponema sp.]|jgi:cation diffusion facilitator family transporter|nr:cation diffusion facilitator family transporter [Treponema sp.]
MSGMKAGYIEGVVSIIINTALFAFKLWVGIITGSIALTADAWHTFSDSLSSIIVVIAVKLSAKKADKEHPFGYGRWEQIAALFIAFFLSVIAFEFVKTAIVEFRDKESVQFGVIAIVVTSVSIVVKELLAQYAFYLGRKTDSAAIKADGWHHRSDALSSVVVLIGILFAKQFWWIDSVLGVIVALLLFHAAYCIIKRVITELLGEKPSADLVGKIKDAIKGVYGRDLDVHHFHIHNYVVHKELTFHIRLDGTMSIGDGHAIASDIERMVEDRFGIIATIHVEPPKGCLNTSQRAL